MVCREFAGPAAMHGKTLLLFTALLLSIQALCLQVEDEKKVYLGHSHLDFKTLAFSTKSF